MKLLAVTILSLFTGVASAGEEYVVDSLRDSGSGTLRDALARGSRVITFRVGGTIHLRKMLEFSGGDVVLDGSSAPRPGITVRDKTFSLNGARNVTIRHLRFRHAENDSFRVIGACDNIRLENCSFTHGGDGALDITMDYKTRQRPRNVSVHRCLIAATDKAMLVVGADRLTLQQNLFTNTGQRNPQLHDAREFNLINNVIRNFTVYGVRARAGATGNIVGNSIPLSPLLPKRPDRTLLIDQKSGHCRVYTAGNLGPSRHDPNRLGNLRSPLRAMPDSLPVTGLEGLLEQCVGARPLDDVDRPLVANNPRIRFRPSNTKDK